jgi:dTDP-glucose pyrophosphorylase
MFYWAMKSLEAFFEEEFIFITQSAHEPTQFLKEVCVELGIETYKELKLPEYTDGQATTALAAQEVLSKKDSIAVFNIDTFIEPGQIQPSDIKGDGFIPVFSAAGERWSFVREDNNGNAIQVSEKEKISDNATAGFYYFDRWNDFVTAYESRSETVESRYGEKYIAPLYNHLIDDKKQIRTHHIDSDAIHVMGTPEDLQTFESTDIEL